MVQLIDCAIVGAGPGGLTAAIYLARYRRHIMVIGDGQSRASLIPLSHNYPGFPEGVAGKILLQRLTDQLECYGGQVIDDTIKKITRLDNSFELLGNHMKVQAKKVILATGVVDIEPSLPNVKDAVRCGLIRHCSICDGYEVIDQRIGVIGTGNKGVKEALFLRTYSSQITLFTLGNNHLSNKKIHDLKSVGIKLIEDPIQRVELKENVISALITQTGDVFYFDTLYSALGSVVRSNLAIQIGAKNINHYLLVNDHQETSVPGLFAIGDIVLGLNQLCVATAHGAIAATHIHNCLK